MPGLIQTVTDAVSINVLASIWAGYVVVRLETLAQHHRDLRERVITEHTEDDG